MTVTSKCNFYYKPYSYLYYKGDELMENYRNDQSQNKNQNQNQQNDQSQNKNQQNQNQNQSQQNSSNKKNN